MHVQCYYYNGRSVKSQGCKPLFFTSSQNFNREFPYPSPAVGNTACCTAMASVRASTSSIQFMGPKLTRIVPSGRVPAVLCASGAQCRPHRSARFHRLHSASPNSTGSCPTGIKETTPLCGTPENTVMLLISSSRQIVSTVSLRSRRRISSVPR